MSLTANGRGKMKRIPSGASIRVGSIFVPVQQLPQILARNTKLLFCLTGLDSHPYSLRGSATGLRFSGQHLLFCCRHQIIDQSPANVVIPVDKSGRILVSGTQFICLNDLAKFSGEEMTDVCAMRFDPANYDEPQLERGFFDIKGADVWNGESETTFLVFGYPTSLRNLNIDEPSGALDNIAVKMTAITASYGRASSAAGVHAINLERTGTYSSDGLSGGSVFHVGEDARGFYCGFAGIVLRGSDSSDIIHFMDARLIRHFFDFQSELQKNQIATVS